MKTRSITVVRGKSYIIAGTADRKVFTRNDRQPAEYVRKPLFSC